ncbi:DMT family transporter [Brucepastera parasyntrophica]|uniref:DMT family transporter n=1 Tax=Brucepastera parasyntrophica TaxID=2880008 RepID=UPI00210F1C3B|nr:DMT family transporter [Brucepastera parasyntrophica]ULQ59645.1 DMT family transporter [Brucepastera parasyntrophica]
MFWHNKSGFRDSRGLSIASLVLCAFLWSSGGVLIKLVDWDPFAIAGIRSIIGFITMIVLVGLPRFTFSFSQITAAVCYSATMILFMFANKTTTAANAILLQYTQPIYIVILGKWLLPDEKTGLSDWIAITGIFCGMVLFFLDDLSFQANLGNILAAISGLTYAISAIFIRRQKNERPADSFMLAHLITFIFSVYFIIRGGMPSLTGIAGLLLLGIFQTGIPSVLYARGVSGVPAITASLITMLEPIMSPVWVALFIGEIPSVRTLIGGGIILVSVTVRTIFKERREKNIKTAQKV